MKPSLFVALTCLAGASASAQSIKPHPLGAVQSTSKELLGLPTLARPLAGGGVIVNDVARRRLLLLDATLENYSVIADSTAGSANGYGQRPGALIPYVADSTLFLDATSSSFLVIDPAGKVARVMSPPRPTDNGAIANVVNGFPGFDARGRMIYRTTFRPSIGQARDGSIQVATPADSAPLLSVDLDTRRADTIAYLRTAKTIPNTITMPDGRSMQMSLPAPLPTIDDWAVLSDGSIAIVRGREYRVDFIGADGAKRTSDKIAFDWKRLSDEDKLAWIDSVQKARAAGTAAGPGGPMTVFGGAGAGQMIIGGGGGGGGVRAGTVTEQIVVGGAAAAAAGPAAAGGPALAGMPAIPAPSIGDMPDYVPAFTQTSARPDMDANLWIRTTTAGAAPGNVVYDVINSKGVLVDRVDVPKDLQIIGFGRGGVVYLSQREGYGFRVLKASVR